MTSGPLTPPIVLYRSRGTIEYDEDSLGSVVAMVVGGEEICRRCEIGGFT